jgi:hypothetical protein
MTVQRTILIGLLLTSFSVQSEVVARDVSLPDGLGPATG